ncbi:MAG: sugar ABC transporter ATP-binding protein [Planctomycetes bacterium]|nr:sugar ABC transporter ATP-binding protein [Planctomycetota bacterium]
MAEGDPFLRMRGICKSFAGAPVLKDVDLDVRPGEVHAIVGENGAGKSTLMKIAAGAYHPDSGEIIVAGKPRTFRRPVDAIAAGIAMIYQELNLAPHLTVAQNIFLGREPRRARLFLDRTKLRAKSQGLIDRHHFDLNATDRVLSLPTGQRQLVEILKALAADSRLLIMDEPTSSLSESETEELFRIIDALRSAGVGVVYISHRLEEVKRIADRITILRDGEKVAEDENHAIDIPTIVRHMVGREITEFYPPREADIGDVVLSVRNFSCGKMFRSISFDLKAGEIVGMAGLVGAGRTDVAEAVFGVRSLDGGEVLLDGRKISVRSPQEAVRHGIGLLTEDRKRSGLCLNLPVAWNVTLANIQAVLSKLMVNGRRERAVAEDYIDGLGIRGAHAGRMAGLLSGGNQQKVVIARWLFRDSRVLLFDEPTRGIDVGAKRDVYELMNRLASEGKAMLFISSELPELLGMCDRILVMHRGSIVADVNAKETTAEEVMHYAAMGKGKA